MIVIIEHLNFCFFVLAELGKMPHKKDCIRFEVHIVQRAVTRMHKI
jgi:hypothetical protein